MHRPNTVNFKIFDLGVFLGKNHGYHDEIKNSKIHRIQPKYALLTMISNISI